MASHKAGSPYAWRNHLIDEEERDRKFVAALARGLEILRAFTPDDEYLGNREITKRTGIPPSTVSRLTYTLAKLGYLRHDKVVDKYQLDIGTLALGYRRLAQDKVRAVARPYMQALSEATGCFVGLAAADGVEMVYTDVFQGRGPLVLRVETGSRLPMALVGKSYIAALPQQRRSQLIAQLEACSEPRQWDKAQARIERALQQYQDFGFCIATGDWIPEVSGVSTPLVLDGGSEILDIHCGGLTRHLPFEALQQNIGPRLLALAKRIKADLGR
jgi:DNA-binding IclR family transcriptional regulator